MHRNNGTLWAQMSSSTLGAKGRAVAPITSCHVIALSDGRAVGGREWVSFTMTTTAFSIEVAWHLRRVGSVQKDHSAFSRAD